MALADAGALLRNENGIATVVSILKKRFGDNAQSGKSIREQHAHTTSYVPNQAPDLVVFAESAEDVQEVVRLCGEWQVPVIHSERALPWKAMSTRLQAAFPLTFRA